MYLSTILYSKYCCTGDLTAETDDRTQYECSYKSLWNAWRGKKYKSLWNREVFFMQKPSTVSQIFIYVCYESAILRAFCPFFGAKDPHILNTQK